RGGLGSAEGGVVAHGLYLVNLASEKFVEQSVAALRNTLEVVTAIGGDGVVFHVGSHLGEGMAAGMEHCVAGITSVLELTSESVWLLMEDSAGAGGTIGRSIDELAPLFDACGRHPRLGICLDTCHLFVSDVDVTDR